MTTQRTLTVRTASKAALTVLVTLVAASACTPFAASSSTLSSTEVTGRPAPQAPVRRAASVVADTPAATPATVPAPPASPAAAPAPAAPRPGSFVTPGRRMGIGGCELFPADNAFHATVTSLPVRQDSNQVLFAAGGINTKVRAGFTAGVYHGSRGGYPVNLVDSRTDETVDYTVVKYAENAVAERHTVPAEPKFEGWPSAAWDRHLLSVDTATCTTSEAMQAIPARMNPTGRWLADSATKFDLGSNELPAKGSTTAAGFSLLHGLVRYDEVAAGNVAHAVTVTLPQIRPGEAVWPARFTDGKGTVPFLPQMGSWLRLKATANLSGLGPEALAVARAMQVHGAVVGDTGAEGLTITGEPDVRWNDADLATLGGLSLLDFEVVDPSAMRDGASLTIR